MRIIVTAGFNSSKPALALCNLVVRSGHELAGVIIVSPFNFSRVAAVVKQQGLNGIVDGLSKLRGGSPNAKVESLYPAWLSDINIKESKISQWCQSNGVPHLVVKNLNLPGTVDFVRQSKVDALIYGGGGILRNELIDAANCNVINPHSGPLPGIRGMNAIEWALMLDEALEVTVHFIDKGIDTGDIISSVPVQLRPNLQLEELRETAVITAVMEIYRLLSNATNIEDIPRSTQPTTTLTRQCYIMAPLLVSMTREKLTNTCTAHSNG